MLSTCGYSNPGSTVGTHILTWIENKNLNEMQHTFLSLNFSTVSCCLLRFIVLDAGFFLVSLAPGDADMTFICSDIGCSDGSLL